jgi:hypothetical protein
MGFENGVIGKYEIEGGVERAGVIRASGELMEEREEVERGEVGGEVGGEVEGGEVEGGEGRGGEVEGGEERCCS